MNEELINNVSNKLGFKNYQVKSVIKMLEDGATIPFMARYRKEATGNLNEDDLRSIETEYKYAVNLKERKEDVIRLIAEKGLLTLELKEEILNCEKIKEVDDIYLPYKEKRKTKGTEAIKLGLEPLAKLIMTFPKASAKDLATNFLNEKVKSVDEAITNAGYIIADWISDNPKYRKWIKSYFYRWGIVKTKIKKEAVDEKKLYTIYYDFSIKITDIKPHQILAINRANKENIISYNLKVEDAKILAYLEKEVLKGAKFPLEEKVKSFILDAWKRLMFPSLERDIKADIYDKASEFGIKEFGSNLENLLLTPPIKEKVVLGFDPGFRTGCKLAVLQGNGNLLDIGVIYPHEPKNLVKEAEDIMLNLINKYHIDIIAIGNGTASRESEKFVANLIKKKALKVKYVIVSEAGASIYSASTIAKKEFPDFSVEQRSAVSIGRRLQDSLSELVKIDPKGIGVGLYQHDLKTKELDEELAFVVSKIVNKVGVNLNNASEAILKYVSGLNQKLITKIMKYKKEKGLFKSREDLRKLFNKDSLAFEQSAGFLRILNGNNPLDKTNIHPEDYPLVEKIALEYNLDLNLVGKEQIIEQLNKIEENKLSQEYNISLDKIKMLKDNLVNGIIDPRDEIKQMTLRSDILSIDDLKVGDTLEGTVRNVTSFGAFVDIGLHDDALIHISCLSKEYVKHPSEILKVGDIIEVHIKEIDKERQRVNLTLI